MKNKVLIEKYRQGEKRALGELYNNNKGLIYRVSLPFVNVDREGRTLDDYMQESFLIMLKAVKAYDGKYAFSTYLGNALKWSFIRMRRKDGNESTTLDEPLKDTTYTKKDLLEDSAAKEAFENIIDRQEQNYVHGVLEDALKRLTVEQGDIIRGRYYNGLSFGDISNLYKIGVKILRQKHTKGISLLRNDRRMRALLGDKIKELRGNYFCGGKDPTGTSAVLFIEIEELIKKYEKM